MTECPSGSNKTLEQCCKPLIDGDKMPETPEALMCSRYIKASMAGKALEQFLQTEHLPKVTSLIWLNYRILATYPSKTESDHAFVDFVVTYQAKTKTQYLHEISEFALMDGRWFYIDGVIMSPASVGAVKSIKSAAVKLVRLIA